MSGPLREKLRRCWPAEVLWNYPLARCCTLRVGGPAAAAVIPSGLGQLRQLVACLNEQRLAWRVIGGGSNILVPDQGFAGVVIILDSGFGAIRPSVLDGRRVAVQVEAGCRLNRLVRWTVDQELTGLEFAAGIPGSLGGAVVMNAGAWGSEMADVVGSVTIMDRTGEITSRDRGEIDFGYRSWGGERGSVVVAATLILEKGCRQTIERACREFSWRRKESQPQGMASAGSFFKNPPGDAAGRLIEAAGLKGTTIGGAKVSEKHANFIVNTGTATAADILELMELVRKRVEEHAGIRLEPEVDIWDSGEEH